MQATLSSNLETHSGPYSRPVRELLDFLALEFGVLEEAPVRVLLGALLPLDGFRPPRITLETDWLSRYFDTDAWFALGGAVHPYSLGLVRAPGVYRRAAHILAEANDRQRAEGIASVFVEPDWRTPEKWFHCRQYAESYLAESLRVRVRQPKKVMPADRQAREARDAKMRDLVHTVLSPGLRSRRAPEAGFPPNYAYWCELGLKLARPWPVIPWQWLAGAVAEVAIRNAVLEGRARATAEDWNLAGKALGWQAPVWTAELLQGLGEGHDRARLPPFVSLEELRERGRAGKYEQSLIVKRTGDLAREAKRLEKEGILQYRAGKGRTGKQWRLTGPPVCCHVLRVLEGRSFDKDSQEPVGPHMRGKEKGDHHSPQEDK